MTDDEAKTAIAAIRRAMPRNLMVMAVLDWIEAKAKLWSSMRQIIDKPKRSRAAYMREYRKKAKSDMGDFD